MLTNLKASILQLCFYSNTVLYCSPFVRASWIICGRKSRIRMCRAYFVRQPCITLLVYSPERNSCQRRMLWTLVHIYILDNENWLVHANEFGSKFYLIFINTLSYDAVMWLENNFLYRSCLPCQEDPVLSVAFKMKVNLTTRLIMIPLATLDAAVNIYDKFCLGDVKVL